MESQKEIYEHNKEQENTKPHSFDIGEEVQVLRTSGEYTDAVVASIDEATGRVTVYWETEDGNVYEKRVLPDKLQKATDVQEESIDDLRMEESRKDMLERFIREYRSDLKEAYERHRSTLDGSHEQAAAQGDINYYKSQIDYYWNQLRQL